MAIRFAVALGVAAAGGFSTGAAAVQAAGANQPRLGGSADAAPTVAFARVANSPFSVGPKPGRPEIADMNGDAKPDIVVVCGSQGEPGSANVFVLLNDGRAQFAAGPGSPFKVGPVHKLAVGDVNGDAKADVAAVEHDSYNVTLMLGDGKGGLQTAAWSPVAAATGQRPHTHDIALADVNRDGKFDVLTTNADDNAISVLLNDGAGKFTAAEGSPFATGRHPYESLNVVDVNSDGKVDIAVTLLMDNRIAVLVGNGKGQFESPAAMRFAVGERPGYAKAVDVNGDRHVDLLTTHDDVGRVDVLLGDGKGGFAAAANSPMRLDVGVWGFAAGDVNRDGRVDLVLGPMRDENVVALLGNGNGTFVRAMLSEANGGKQPNYVALADLNGDNKLDLVTGNYGSGDVSVMVGK
ncbi:MAG: VCBS repeat-containing protein [Phycisphaerales bacterium]|nr:VCBS repeat-containing protein [Phycisphaerales bacterium]